MTLKSLSRKLELFLNVKYHAKISVLNLRKYITIKTMVILDPDIRGVIDKFVSFSIGSLYMGGVSLLSVINKSYLLLIGRKD